MGAGRLIVTATIVVTTAAAGQLTATAPALAASSGPAVTASWQGPDLEGSAWAAASPTRLVLTVAKGESARPVQQRAVLTCAPPGGTHHQARGACAALAKVRGDFAKLQVGDGMCTMQYDPVTVSASGLWRGHKVNYVHTFGNACTLSTSTGPVFSL